MNGVTILAALMRCVFLSTDRFSVVIEITFIFRACLILIWFFLIDFSMALEFLVGFEQGLRVLIVWICISWRQICNCCCSSICIFNCCCAFWCNLSGNFISLGSWNKRFHQRPYCCSLKSALLNFLHCLTKGCWSCSWCSGLWEGSVSTSACFNFACSIYCTLVCNRRVTLFAHIGVWVMILALWHLSLLFSCLLFFTLLSWKLYLDSIHSPHKCDQALSWSKQLNAYIIEVLIVAFETSLG